MEPSMTPHTHRWVRCIYKDQVIEIRCAVCHLTPLGVLDQRRIGG